MATPTIEEYLETIYAMQSEGAPIIGARVAERMGVSAPTMTETLRRMAKQGFVAVGEGKAIALTPKGRDAAEALVRRHRLSERWLTDVLGLDWATAHREACKLEHAISPEVEERLAKVLNHPSTCPHGNPIPGLGPEPVEGLLPLDQVNPGKEIAVVRISPSAEEDPRILDYLEGNGLVPGARLHVLEVAPWAGVVTLSRGGADLSISTQIASHLWVRVHG